MPQDEDSRKREQTLAAHQAQQRHLLEKDMRAWADGFAEDAVFELPFAPADYPKQIEGRDAIYEYVKDYPEHIDLQGYTDVTVHETQDPAVIVVEAKVEARVVATGKPYDVGYVWVITVEDGQIVRQRDYWNPLAVMEALGGGEGMRDTFNVNYEEEN